MISDQRTNNRMSFFVGGDMYRDALGEKRMGRVIIRDISVDGLCVECLDALEVGDGVFVDFEIAGRFFFRHVPVTVTRVQKNQGSYLTGLNLRQGEDRRRIKSALAFSIESSSS